MSDASLDDRALTIVQFCVQLFGGRIEIVVHLRTRIEYSERHKVVVLFVGVQLLQAGLNGVLRIRIVCCYHGLDG